MKNNYTIISCYTPNYKSIYEKYLKPSLENLPIKNLVLPIPKMNSWKEATKYKPIFILDCLNKLQTDVVFTDVDSTINKYPILFDNVPQNYDIAIHYLDWMVQFGHKNKKELLTGTLYLRNNDKIRLLIHKWIDISKQIGRDDQKGLDNALKQLPDIKVFELPREYCYISSNPIKINKGKPKIILDNPIITHYQASRLNKKK